MQLLKGGLFLVTGVHEEAQEDDVHNGYALIEYEHFEEAQKAISEMNGATLLTQVINVDWAFSNGPSTGVMRRKNMSECTLFPDLVKFSRPGGRCSRSPKRRY
ncbi:hypothetical protein ACFE04_005995 [Oxalis oulophora]